MTARFMRAFPSARGALVPLLVSVAAIAGSLFPLPAVRDAVTLERVGHVRLAVGPWFVLFSPLYNIWDTQSLLPASRHVAVLSFALAAYFLWRSRIAGRESRVIAWRELTSAATALALLVVWVVTGALVPRPMVSLEVDDPDAVVVDFHSHTDASHDGRAGFSAERNREWHRSAGFDVAYVSDHGTYAAVREALTRNPVRAGDGTVLLPAYETLHAGQHLNVLGFAAAAAIGYTPPNTLSSHPGSGPSAMLTIPAALGDAANGAAMAAVELIDGSPRGLEFGARRRAELQRLCLQLGAAPVAGSNNHGWGRTAPGWTILEIPGWRTLSPIALDEAILATLASRDRSRVVVIERARPVAPDESVQLAGLSDFVRNPFRTLTMAEQLAWIVWVWFGWWIARLGRRRVGKSTRSEP